MSWLLNAIGTFIAVTSALMIAIFLVRRSIINTTRAYFEPKTPGTPSEFGQALDNISQMFAARIMASLKATFMGVNSGLARGEKALEEAAQTDLASQASPLAGMAMRMPTVARLIRRNPGLLDLAMPFLSKMAAGSATGSSPGAVAPSAPGNGSINTFEL